MSPHLEELQHLRRTWGWFVGLGIALILLGTMAISASFVATLATVLMFGYLLLAAGVVEMVTILWSPRWHGFWMHLLGGVLYMILGVLMIGHPLAAAEFFTLMIAAAFLVGGMFRIVAALTERFHSWGWVLLNGVVTFALGIMIWRRWPESSFWVIGLFVGIEMIFAGWAWVMIGLAVKQVPAPTA
jgi:uncharacterized membrane protein HdeD (DUF308 family)